MTEDQYKNYVSKNITKKGNNDHQSKGQKVLAIVDMVTNKRLSDVQLMSPISLDNIKYSFTHYKSIPIDILNDARLLSRSGNGVSHIKVGDVDKNSSFKATTWLSNSKVKNNEDDLRFKKLSNMEILKNGRGIKPSDIKEFLKGKYDNTVHPSFNNHNKKEALIELENLKRETFNALNEFKNAVSTNEFPKGWNQYNTQILINQFENKLKYIQHDIDIIKSGTYDLSMMNKYKEAKICEDLENERINYFETHDNIDHIPPTFQIDRNDIYYELPFRESIERSIDEMSNKEFSFLEEAPNVSEKKAESLPKQTDKVESNKNGIRRKKLYIAFIEWCKEYNNKNTFGSIFDKDAFNITYPFVPDEMRYFYRLANPILCVLSGNLTFFQVSELKKLNSKNSRMNEMMIFAATENDFRVFNKKDKKIYRAIDKDGALTLMEPLASNFDLYIQNMIKKGDILNGPINESTDLFNNNESKDLYKDKFIGEWIQ